MNTTDSSGERGQTPPLPPAITVVIPAYNAGNYLAATLDSVLNEGTQNVQIVVVDDASQDDTGAVAARYASRGVEYLRLDRNSGGPARPRNVGIGAARAPVVAIFDSDDLMLPGRLSLSLQLMNARPDIALAFTDAVRFQDGTSPKGGSAFLADYSGFAALPKTSLDPAWAVLEPPHGYEGLCFENFIPTSSVTLRVSALQELGVFDDTLTNGDDFDLWLRLARDRAVGVVTRVTVHYRERASGISGRGALLSEARIAVLRRQLGLDQTPRIVRQLRYQIALNRYAQGYYHQERGELRLARAYYVQSVRERPGWYAIKGLLISMLGRRVLRLLQSLRARA
ncbi:MAG: glycosyltransferase family 2 protein [Acidobacteriota bacterium]